MDLVRFALEEHRGRGDAGPVVAWEKDGERKSFRLPDDGDPVAAANDVLLRPAVMWPPLRRAVVVWRAELDMGDGTAVPLRYACGHVAGEPESSLFAQHYAVTPEGEQPLGEPEPVDTAEPLIPRVRRGLRRSGRHREIPWWRDQPVVAASAGFFAGVSLADLAVWTADRYGPSTRHAATVVQAYVDERARHPADYHVIAETASGEYVDFARAEPQWVYSVVERGQRIQVSLSELTGRPVAFDAAGLHYDLVGHGVTWLRVGIPGAVLLAVAVYLALAPKRNRYRWGLPAVAAAFLATTLVLVGVI